MRFSILHTSARPEKWREVYEAWLGAADHPEEVEYVLVVDERWGFTFGPTAFAGFDRKARERPLDRLFYIAADILPKGHSGYVYGVNLAADKAAGDIFIVNADDQFPCEHWDTIISEAIGKLDGEFDDFVVWANTGTPQEIERRIMPMPILSAARYHKLGYVFYPKYESMYADNDFCGMALAEGAITMRSAGGVCGVNRAAGTCRVIYLDPSHLFEHRHPYFFGSGVEVDEAYRQQNRVEAYNLGAALFAKRKANGFKDVADDPVVNPSTVTRRKLVICLGGETFSAAWVSKLLELMQLTRYHELRFVFAQSSNVYHTRIQLAVEALNMRPEPDYIVWIDDDNLVSVQQVAQAVLDLECVSTPGMIAGWTLTGSNTAPSSTEEISCGRLTPEFDRTSLSAEGLLSGVEDLKEVDYTGFPFVVMRRVMLADVGPGGFAPYPVDFDKHGVVGEDISFCIRAREKGYRLFVDRRIMVPHLKLRDITQRLLRPVVSTTSYAAAQNDLPRADVGEIPIPAAV